jgi:hypothetical protein
MNDGADMFLSIFSLFFAVAMIIFSLLTFFGVFPGFSNQPSYHTHSSRPAHTATVPAGK